MGQVFIIGRSFLSLSIFPKSQEKAHLEAGGASGLDWFFVRVQQWVDLSWRVGDAVQESLIFLSHSHPIPIPISHLSHLQKWVILGQGR